jgi:hypothetical protein
VFFGGDGDRAGADERIKHDAGSPPLMSADGTQRAGGQLAAVDGLASAYSPPLSASFLPTSAASCSQVPKAIPSGSARFVAPPTSPSGIKP